MIDLGIPLQSLLCVVAVLRHGCCKKVVETDMAQQFYVANPPEAIIYIHLKSL